MSWHHHRLDPSIAIGLPVESYGAIEAHRLQHQRVTVTLWRKGRLWFGSASHPCDPDATVVRVGRGFDTPVSAVPELLAVLESAEAVQSNPQARLHVRRALLDNSYREIGPCVAQGRAA